MWWMMVAVASLIWVLGPQKLWLVAFAPTLKGEKSTLVFVAVENTLLSV